MGSYGVFNSCIYISTTWTGCAIPHFTLSKSTNLHTLENLDQLHSLLQLGLSARVIDIASNVGGTWFWNKYPGAMSDTESYIYRFSWDKEALETYLWPEHYVKQREVLAYLSHVVDKHDLRKYMQFNTEMVGADWDEESGLWRLVLGTGEVWRARFLVTALGLLSRTNYPDIKEIETFGGEKYHTAKCPDELEFEGKKFGVIGCGSTGVQVITAIASKVKSLTCFQRHPQYSVPSGDGPVSLEYRKSINENYEAIFDQVKSSVTGFGVVESKTPMFSVSPEERERVLEEHWKKGNGFRFMFGTFSDITTNEQANEAVCDFIRKKIAQTVKDPEKASRLQPRDLYARRPLYDSGYFQKYNQDNVDIVSLQETPIEEITEVGIKTSDGRIYELDMIIFATGFDAVEGNYTRLRVRGRNGESMKDHWENGPAAYVGVSVPGFPNLFMILGAGGAFCNIPHLVEAQVEFITAAIRKASEAGNDRGLVEATQEAEDEWLEICERTAAGSLFWKTDSWIFGAVCAVIFAFETITVV